MKPHSITKDIDMEIINLYKNGNYKLRILKEYKNKGIYEDIIPI
jgi:hypothetical protein